MSKSCPAINHTYWYTGGRQSVANELKLFHWVNVVAAKRSIKGQYWWLTASNLSLHHGYYAEHVAVSLEEPAQALSLWK